jgi:hypothetical protein
MEVGSQPSREGKDGQVKAYVGDIHYHAYAGETGLPGRFFGVKSWDYLFELLIGLFSSHLLTRPTWTQSGVLAWPMPK